MLAVGATRPELRAVADQVGNPTSALDLADVITTVLLRMQATGWRAEYAGVFHATALDSTSWHGFAEAIFAEARAYGGPSPVVHGISTAEDPPRPCGRRIRGWRGRGWGRCLAPGCRGGGKGWRGSCDGSLMPPDLEKDDAFRPVDLAEGSLHLQFSVSALADGAAVDLFRGDVIVLHLKYLPARHGFVLNDRRDGSWGAEVILECPSPHALRWLPVTLTIQEGEPHLQLGESPAASLGTRFDLDGQLLARIPSSVRAEEWAGAVSKLPAQARALAQAVAPMAACDALVISDAGLWLEGWSDDRHAPLTHIVVTDRLRGDVSEGTIHRVRRPDIEDALYPGTAYEFGLWAAVPLGGRLHARDLDVSLVTADGNASPLDVPTETAKPAADFLDFLLSHLAQRRLIGNISARSFTDLDRGHGAMLAQLRERVEATHSVRLEARFGPRAPRCRLSFVSVLFGVAELMYLMISQFARFGPLDGVEFVFVSNSPELEDSLVRDAELASVVFHARIVLVSLNQNCGFSHANNVGVELAQASTVCVVNPDVFPREAPALAHLLGLAEADQDGAIIGGKLHYADGSVMHEGMVFAQDHRLSSLTGTLVWSVEHPRKGFPDAAGNRPRRVSAVSGALMLMEKAAYERVGGFDTGFIHGYYEDADLCLRLRDAGAEVLVDPRLDFWHYEGKGSTVHAASGGARLYNQWRFSRRWGESLRQAADA